MADAGAHSAFDSWLAGEAISFHPDSPDSVVDHMMAALDPSLELLGFGEVLHGGEEILTLRNKLFQCLVKAHGFTAIAIESSFPRARALNDYVRGRTDQSYDALAQSAFSYGFTGLEANRELVEWMREYNASNGNTLSFYGFDSPTEMMKSDSPRQVLRVALDGLELVDASTAGERRQRMDELIGDDAEWENPQANFDPSQSIGQSPASRELRVETENLIAHLRVRSPEFVSTTGEARYAEALHFAQMARDLLTYHALVATPSPTRIADLLGLRDAMMAGNLQYILSREKGKVLAFAHNTHLKRAQASWQLGPQLLEWWPAGAHLATALGSRYAVIGTALGASPDNGIPAPEAGTLEARLAATPGPARMVPTRSDKSSFSEDLASIPVRGPGAKNSTYFPLNAQSFADFDWILAMNSVSYARGAPKLP